MSIPATATARRPAPPQRWMGGGEVLLRTRTARRDGDVGAALRALARTGDRAVGLRLRGRRVLLLLDPALVGELLVERAADTAKGPALARTRDLLGEGLLTGEGEAHRRARRLIAPAFSSRRLAGYVEVFAQCAAEHTGRWREGQSVDMHREMATLTLDLVGRTLLGIDLAVQAPEIRTSLDAALTRYAETSAGMGCPRILRRDTDPLAPSASRPRAGRSGVLAAVDPIHRIVDDIITARRDQPTGAEERGDVLSVLLAAATAVDGLSPAQVHDHVITLLMAGHETTANALTWALHLLARHRDVADRLHAEVDALGGALPAYADLPGLAYTRAVISEALRLYPAAWIIGRTLTTGLDLGGWHAPAGTVVAASPLLLHRDPRHFPDPDRFEPDRWLDSRRERLPRHAYLPFGTGPRACIGEQFAWAETVTLLAVIAARWSAATDPGNTPVPQYRITLRPTGGLPMHVHVRDHHQAPPA